MEGLRHENGHRVFEIAGLFLCGVGCCPNSDTRRGNLGHKRKTPSGCRVVKSGRGAGRCVWSHQGRSKAAPDSDRRLSRLSATTSGFYQSAAWNSLGPGELSDVPSRRSAHIGPPNGLSLPPAGAVSVGTMLAAVDYLIVPSLSGSAPRPCQAASVREEDWGRCFLFGTDVGVATFIGACRSLSIGAFHGKLSDRPQPAPGWGRFFWANPMSKVDHHSLPEAS